MLNNRIDEDQEYMKELEKEKQEKNMTEEEKAWAKMENFMINPITGKKDCKVSSQKMKKVWLLI